MILNCKPDLIQFYIPTTKSRKKLFDFVNSQKFDFFILLCILLNIQTMGLVYEGGTDNYSNTLEKINYFFTAIFILEAILKITALSPKGYLISGWNKFDLFVVIASLVDIMLSVFIEDNKNTKLLRIGP